MTARPEDEACGYIDHRASALPLVGAMEDLGGLVQLHVLDPATLPALRRELERARDARKPYHVAHFDGHGVYDRRIGLGGLCFELPEDETRLVQPRRVRLGGDAQHRRRGAGRAGAPAGAELLGGRLRRPDAGARPPDLHYTSAAEILLLLEALEQRKR